MSGSYHDQLAQTARQIAELSLQKERVDRMLDEAKRNYEKLQVAASVQDAEKEAAQKAAKSNKPAEPKEISKQDK